MKEKEKILLSATITYLVEGSAVWLAIKADKIGKGKWNGYGGGIEAGETKEMCAIREPYEESGVVIREEDLEYRGYMDFHNTTEEGKTFVCRAHIFIAKKWKGGSPKEIIDPKKRKIEMLTPTLFPISKLPFENFMPADSFWLPQVLAGNIIRGTAFYAPHQKELLCPVEVEIIGLFK